VLLEKRRRKVLPALDQRVVRLRLVHGEVEAVLVALRSIGEVGAVGAVREHEQLQVFEQRLLDTEALLAVAVNLVDRHM
jgi:hypothetical protein